MKARTLAISSGVRGGGAVADLSAGFTDGLVVTFKSIDDRNQYNTDPGHVRILQDEIVPDLETGAGSLLRFDFMEAATRD